MQARCPECGDASRAVHSRYHRHLADLPALGHEIRIRLVIRRFYCRNAHCPRRTFAEPMGWHCQIKQICESLATFLVSILASGFEI
jgi:hypothetical protein